MKAPNDFKQAIQSYLDERVKTDELFAKSYAKKNKSIDECYAYIMGEAIRNSANLASNVKGCMMENDVVYGMAVHYYDEDDIKINKLSANVKASVSASASKPHKIKEDKEMKVIHNNKKDMPNDCTYEEKESLIQLSLFS